MGNNMGLILEKLSFEKIVKPQINLIWKVIFSKYVVDSKKPGLESNRFAFNAKHIYLSHDSYVQDLNSIYYNFQINVVYDFNKAKKLFIKEPYVVFCVDSNEVSFDFTEDLIREKFFERLDWTVFGNYLSWVKEDFPTVYWFLVNVMGYNDSDLSLHIKKGDTENIKDYPVGRELFDKAWEMIESGLYGKEVVPSHRIGWIDGHLYPIFIWDTQEGFVYSCNVGSDQLNLDRRSLNKRTIVKVKDSRFMETDLSKVFSRRLGFVYNGLDNLWIDL